MWLQAAQPCQDRRIGVKAEMIVEILQGQVGLQGRGDHSPLGDDLCDQRMVHGIDPGGGNQFAHLH